MILLINYTNYRGENSNRMIEPIHIDFGSTEFHPEKQWLLLAKDREKAALRTFAIKDMTILSAAVGKRERDQITLRAIRNIIKLKDGIPFNLAETLPAPSRD